MELCKGSFLSFARLGDGGYTSARLLPNLCPFEVKLAQYLAVLDLVRTVSSVLAWNEQTSLERQDPPNNPKDKRSLYDVSCVSCFSHYTTSLGRRQKVSYPR